MVRHGLFRLMVLPSKYVRCALWCMGLLFHAGCMGASAGGGASMPPPTAAERKNSRGVTLDPEISLALDRYMFGLYRKARGVTTTDPLAMSQVRAESRELREQGKLQWKITAARRMQTPHLFLWVTFNEPMEMDQVLLYSERRRSIRHVPTQP
jgi:hypothetical protein